MSYNNVIINPLTCYCRPRKNQKRGVLQLAEINCIHRLSLSADTRTWFCNLQIIKLFSQLNRVGK